MRVDNKHTRSAYPAIPPVRRNVFLDGYIVGFQVVKLMLPHLGSRFRRRGCDLTVSQNGALRSAKAFAALRTGGHTDSFDY